MAQVETKSNQVAAGIKNLLVVYLKDKIDTRGMRADNIRLQSGAAVIRGGMCPAICLDDKGNVPVDGSLRGKAADGSLLPGYTIEQYTFNAEVYLQGQPGESMREEFNRWRDGIKACLEDHWSLYEGAVQIEVKAGDPEFNTGLESSTLWLGQVTIEAQVIALQGEVAILNS